MIGDFEKGVCAEGGLGFQTWKRFPKTKKDFTLLKQNFVAVGKRAKIERGVGRECARRIAPSRCCVERACPTRFNACGGVSVTLGSLRLRSEALEFIAWDLRIPYSERSCAMSLRQSAVTFAKRLATGASRRDAILPCRRGIISFRAPLNEFQGIESCRAIVSCDSTTTDWHANRVVDAILRTGEFLFMVNCHCVSGEVLLFIGLRASKSMCVALL